MNTTKKLYDFDAYATEFDAVVLACEKHEKKDGCYQIILDQTLFFPEEGGQSPDKGTLDNASVLDVQIKKDCITHTVTAPFPCGAVVHGKIDFSHRFSNMQQHSAEHIFSGLVKKHFGFDNVGFHLSNQIVTMDFNGVLTADDAVSLETAVNQAIAENVTITTGYPSKEELKNLEYRSKIEIDGPVRIVTVSGYDVCACCAPHVKRSGEIGGFKIMNMQSYKGGVRISFLAGFRALNAFREFSSVLTELSALLSSAKEQLPSAVTRIQNENASLKAKLVALKQAQIEERLNSFPASLSDVVLFEQDLETPLMRHAVNRLTETHFGYCAVFNKKSDGGYNYIIGSSSKDCKTLADTLRETFDAKGGGSSVMIQGSVSADENALKNIICGN